MNSTKYKIGIVGFGDFAKVMIEYLAPYAQIVVYSRIKQTGDAGFGAQFASLETVLKQSIIIPSIPAQFFEEFFTRNQKLINPTSLVIDVCSVKIKPLKTLAKLLPKTCQILGTHPMFGPASIAKYSGIVGLKCVITPVRIEEALLRDIEIFLSDNLNLKLINKTAEEHDKEMAYVQGLSHYIGRVMDIMEIPKSELSTLAYDDLMAMKRVQGGDSWELFESIMQQNPYASEINEKFKLACVNLNRRLKQNKS